MVYGMLEKHPSQPNFLYYLCLYLQSLLTIAQVALQWCSILGRHMLEDFQSELSMYLSSNWFSTRAFIIDFLQRSQNLSISHEQNKEKKYSKCSPCQVTLIM